MTTMTQRKKDRRPAFYECKFHRTRIYRLLWGQQYKQHYGKRSNRPEIDDARVFDMSSFNYEHADTFVNTFIGACGFDYDVVNLIFRRLDVLRLASRAARG